MLKIAKVCANGSCEMAGEPQPVENFYKDRSRRDGLTPYCRDCINERVKARQAEMAPEQWRKEKKEAEIRHRYGLEPDAYMQLMGNGCSICAEKDPSKLCVDHDHETGVIRGALCDRCNRGLGCFRDSVILLQGAIFYLGDFREAQC